MKQMKPAGVSVRELYVFCRAHDIPHYPSPEQLGCPVVPPAPLAPEDDDNLIPFGWETYSSMMRAIFDCMPRPDANKAKREAKEAAIATVLRDLRSLEIPPAEWIKKRFGDFFYSPLKDTFAAPPLKFVFARGALMERLKNNDLDWVGSISQSSVKMHDAAREAIANWHQRRRATITAISTLNPDAVEQIWEGWEDQLRESRRAGAYEQVEIIKKVTRGTYVWGATS